jgi:hypothetical protein
VHSFESGEELVEIILGPTSILRWPAMVLGGGAINFRLQSHPFKEHENPPTNSFIVDQFTAHWRAFKEARLVGFNEG